VNNTISAVMQDSLKFINMAFTDTVIAGMLTAASHTVSTNEAVVSADALLGRTARSRRDLASNIDAIVAAHGNEMVEEESASFAALSKTLRMSARALTTDLLARELLRVRDVARQRAPGVALVIRDGRANTTLEGNNIAGIVSLYGAAPISKLSLDNLRDELRNFFKQVQAGSVQIRSLKSVLHMRGNMLTQVVVADNLVKRIIELAQGEGEIDGLHRSAFVSDNLFSSGDNLLAAAHLALTSNHFDPAAGFLVTAAVGETGVYVSNRGPNSDAVLLDVTLESDQAANVRLNIVPP
jgi:hypothetical protein